jgi:uncharacterized protein Yka (UPF0111/DUF47 family)
MFSLQKLMGKDDKFFRLLEACADEARSSISHLKELFKTPGAKRSLAAVVEARRKEKRVTQELTEHLLKTFVTPLEREDIEALSNALYKIPKTVEKFSERLMIAGTQVHDGDFTKHLPLLDQAGDCVVLLVKELRKGVNLEKVKAQNDKLQQIEGEADKLMLELLRDLYNGDHNSMRVVVMKDLLEILEKVFDRCRDAGNVVFHIVLKHS